MKITEPFEDIARQAVRPGIGNGFLDTLPQLVAVRRRSL